MTPEVHIWPSHATHTHTTETHAYTQTYVHIHTSAQERVRGSGVFTKESKHNHVEGSFNYVTSKTLTYNATIASIFFFKTILVQ